MGEENGSLKERNQEIVVIDGVEYERRPNGGLVSKKKAFVDENTNVGTNNQIKQGVHKTWPRECVSEKEILEEVAKIEDLWATLEKEIINF